MCTKGSMPIFVCFPETFHSPFCPVQKVQCCFLWFRKISRMGFAETFFVWFTKFLRNNLFSSHLAKLEGSLLVLPLFIPSQLAEMFFVVDDRSSFSCRIVLPGKLRLQRRRHFRLRSKESLQRNGMSGLVQETQ